MIPEPLSSPPRPSAPFVRTTTLPVAISDHALLEGQASPRQLATLILALDPAYTLIEQRGPELAASLGAAAFPWVALAHNQALRDHVAMLAGAPDTPASATSQDWLARMETLADQPPLRAH